MKIIIVGTRGIPARYGGFETCAEKLSIGLVKRGHKVFVTCRKYLYPEKLKVYKGVNLVYLPSLKNKFTDTFSHTFFSILWAIFKNPDIILVFNSANSPLCILPRILGKKIVINVDGLEWKRRKWGFFGKIYYRFCEFFSCLIANRIIADSKEIKNYYKNKFGKEPIYIPYGADFEILENEEIMKKYGIEKFNYFFNGSRLEPENNQDLIVKSFLKVNTQKKLIIIGKASYKSKYEKRLKMIKDKRIKFIEPIYSPDYNVIMANCYAYIHGNEVGGTNPALLKAMGSGKCILAIDVPFNREVLGDCGFYFKKDTNDLKEKIEFLLRNPYIVEEFGKKARERAKKLYKWEDVVESYEKLFLELAWEKK
ncbi:MAG: DUF1972 domain-containing protein [Candidatus Omnitrophica bacterium]|nr:DUF1972 domain-containing protein [Candidatus Omnitrophota bacterium]